MASLCWIDEESFSKVHFKCWHSLFPSTVLHFCVVVRLPSEEPAWLKELSPSLQRAGISYCTAWYPQSRLLKHKTWHADAWNGSGQSMLIKFRDSTCFPLSKEAVWHLFHSGIALALTHFHSFVELPHSLNQELRDKQGNFPVSKKCK